MPTATHVTEGNFTEFWSPVGSNTILEVKLVLWRELVDLVDVKLALNFRHSVKITPALALYRDSNVAYFP